MVDIPPDEKVIFESGSVTITDKAVYKKGIISSLERYDFNDIVCVFCEIVEHHFPAIHYDEPPPDKESDPTWYHTHSTDKHEKGHYTVSESVKMVLSDGKVLQLSSSSRSYSDDEYHFNDAYFNSDWSLSLLGQNLPPGIIIKSPVSWLASRCMISRIREMIKEHRSSEEIREEVPRIINECRKKEEKIADFIGYLIGAGFAAGAFTLPFGILIMWLAQLVGVAGLVDTPYIVLSLFLILFVPIFLQLYRNPENTGDAIIFLVIALVIASFLTLIPFLLIVWLAGLDLANPATESLYAFLWLILTVLIAKMLQPAEK
jgi:hypothetical protein